MNSRKAQMLIQVPKKARKATNYSLATKIAEESKGCHMLFPLRVFSMREDKFTNYFAIRLLRNIAVATAVVSRFPGGFDRATSSRGRIREEMFCV
jgi:hypothetical protein